jgi:hypothetical protein
MKKLFYLILFSLLALWANAQEVPADKIHEEAGGLRADGKIYVVVTVVITILTGLIVYLIRIDRKISRLEKQ